MTAPQKVIGVASREVGVREQPAGSNTGERVRLYQAATDLAGTGWPWCAAFVEWVYETAGVPHEGLCHPSTWTIFTRAKAQGAIVPRPVPGAMLLWPGKHVGLIVRELAPGLVETIEGNSGDQVAIRRRSLDGALVVAPEAIRLAARPPAPAREFWLEDVAARPVLRGPWRTEAARERVIARLPAARRARVRRRRTAKGGWAFLEGPRRLYGPWGDAHARETAQRRIEARLGRRLRPFSRPAKPTPTPAAEALGKTT